MAGTVNRAAASPAPVLPSALWLGWRDRFVAADGRVVDTGNQDISHSEGQGYGMLLAAKAGDRPAFERIWGWTRARLGVRDDALFAWRFVPDATPPVADLNNASDGDMLIAWALAVASRHWSDGGYRRAAAAITRALQRAAVIDGPSGPLLMPGAAGFGAGERADGPVVNLSYWVFPAFPDLAALVPEYDWKPLVESGLSLANTARFGLSDLPADWTALGGAHPQPAQGFPPVFGWNALRIPLYLTWAGAGTRGHLAPFLRAWKAAPLKPFVADLAGTTPPQSFGSSGYGAIPALVESALEGAPYPAELRQLADEPYYPATLRLLALIAVTERLPACL